MFFFQVETSVYETHVEIMQNVVTRKVVLSAHVCLDAQVTPIGVVCVRDLQQTCVETNTVECMLLAELLTAETLNVTAPVTILQEIHILNVRSCGFCQRIVY
jgi:hypothetical protein